MKNNHMKEDIKVLHVFSEYLPKTQEWLKLLIAHARAKSLLYTKYIIENSHATDVEAYKYSQWYYFDSRQTSPILKKIYAKFLTKVWHPFHQDLDQQFGHREVNIIHAHFSEIACDILNASMVDKLPFIVSFYGWDYEMLPFTRPEYIPKYQQLFNIADRVLVEGPHGKKILIDYGCPPDKIRILPLGIQTSTYQSIPGSKSSDQQLKLVQLASFREKKGQLASLKALRLALDRNLNVSLEFAGNTDEVDYYNEVKAYLDASNLKEHVTFRSFVPYESLENYLKQFDVFIQPSVYSSKRDCEGGAPTTLFNAMLAGLPIITTNHCDIPYVVTNGLNGITCTEGNVHELADAIEHFHKMPAVEYELYSQRAINAIVDRFDIQQNAKKLDAIYAELIQHT